MLTMQRLFGITLVLSIALLASSASARDFKFRAALSPAQTIPLGNPGLIEDAEVKISFSEDFSEAKLKVKVTGGDNIVAAHLHCGEVGVAAGIVVSILGAIGEKNVTITAADLSTGTGCDDITNLVTLAFRMKEGLIYANIHTTDDFSGEVRGQLGA